MPPGTWRQCAQELNIPLIRGSISPGESLCETTSSEIFVPQSYSV